MAAVPFAVVVHAMVDTEMLLGLGRTALAVVLVVLVVAELDTRTGVEGVGHSPWRTCAVMFDR